MTYKLDTNQKQFLSFLSNSESDQAGDGPFLIDRQNQLYFTIALDNELAPAAAYQLAQQAGWETVPQPWRQAYNETEARVGAGGEPVDPIEIEVTRIVELEVAGESVEIQVEVTRLVEIIVTPTSPPPTATPEGPQLGDRGKPHPVGSTVPVVMGGVLEFELTIVQVMRGEAAYQRIKSANQFNDPAPLLLFGGTDGIYFDLTPAE